ncbi:MAG: hypothetical protein ABSE63_10970 [Thermoguttaceae bacterium]|jgi:hypothetical protein
MSRQIHVVGHQIAIFPRFALVGSQDLLAFDLSGYVIGGAIVEKCLAQFQGEKDYSSFLCHNMGQ